MSETLKKNYHLVIIGLAFMLASSLVLIGLDGPFIPPVTPPPTDGPDETVLLKAKQLASDTMYRHKSVYDYGKWGWSGYVLLTGLWRMYEATRDVGYRNHVKTFLDRFIQDNGNFAYDGQSNYSPQTPNELGTFYLAAEMYEETKSAKYLTAARNAANHAMNNWKRTGNGGFEHFQQNNELWIDTTFMVSPLFAKLGQITNDPKYFSEATQQIIAHSNVLQSGLFYHAWDEDGDASWVVSGNHSPEFWGRGNGWASAAIIDVLEFLPGGHKDRPHLTSILDSQLSSLSNVQASSGRWHTVLDKATQAGNYEETSASSLFLYAFKKAKSKGYVSGYPGVVENAVSGLLGKIESRGGRLVVNGVSEGTNPGDYSYYVARNVSYNYKWGDGAALMALSLFT